MATKPLYEERLGKLNHANQVEAISLYEGTRKVRELSRSTSPGSVRVFADALGMEDGLISQEGLANMLHIFAENTDEAKADKNTHPTIQYIFQAQERKLTDLRGVIKFEIPSDLEQRVRELHEVKKAGKLEEKRDKALETFQEVVNLLEKGYLRTAQFSEGGWKLNDWVKQGIMLGFPLGKNIRYGAGDVVFVDKATLPLREIHPSLGIRVVPPAAGLRRGSYAGKGTTFMPPAYANIGSFVGRNTMIENLVGSCAQVGRDSHISAGAIIGGVLDPIEATPVILGDYCLMGEGSGVTQGTRLGDLVTLAPGVHITKATSVVDTIRNKVYRSDGVFELNNSSIGGINIYSVGSKIEEKDKSYGPEIPSGALIIPGILATPRGDLRAAPTIVKYISSSKERSYDLNEDLRKS